MSRGNFPKLLLDFPEYRAILIYMDDIMEYILAEYPEWDTDGFGIDSNFICPHGHMIEQDGIAPDGCVSPMREMGFV